MEVLDPMIPGRDDERWQQAPRALLKLFSVRTTFMTDDILVDTVSLASGVNYSTSVAQSPQLLITCNHSEFKAEMPGEMSNVLHGGEILWVPAGASAKITGATTEGTAAVIIITFKAAEKNAK
jgi:hypothetical protein